MQRAVGFTIYLPVGYADSDKRLPVVCYLNGVTDCESSHPEFFSILHALPNCASGRYPASR